MAFVTSGATVLARKPSAGVAVCNQRSTTPATASTTRMTAASSSDDIPDMAKRNTLNAMLFGTTVGATVAIGGPLAYFFVPPSAGGSGDGVVAKDALGNDIKKAAYIESHLAGSRELAQGLRGDATYLIVTDDKKDLEYYALNAVCTHLGCVVPWSKAENKFKCPCHGSQYAPTGAVVRGPAPLPLALERCEEDEAGNVVLKSWKETDFRTGEAPWWNF